MNIRNISMILQSISFPTFSSQICLNLIIASSPLSVEDQVVLINLYLYKAFPIFFNPKLKQFFMIIGSFFKKFQ